MEKAGFAHWDHPGLLKGHRDKSSFARARESKWHFTVKAREKHEVFFLFLKRAYVHADGNDLTTF